MFSQSKSKILTPRTIREFFKVGQSDEEGKNEPDIPLPIQKKREEIFNSELQSLVESVKSPRQPPGIQHSSTSFLKQYHSLIPPEKKQEQILLEAIYMPKESIQESNIMNYSSYILERVGIETFSWHFLAYDSNAYFCEMSRGVDMVTRKNFLFLKSDPFIKRLDKNFFELEITQDLKNDSFYTKKFSAESISLYSKLYFFFLDEPYADACLVAYQEKSHSEKIESDDEIFIRKKWLRRIGDKIFGLIPALKRYREEKLQPKFSKDEMLTATIHYFKTIIGHGLPRFYVHKIEILNLRKLSEHYYLEKQFISQILQFLERRERVIYVGIHTYLIFSILSLGSKILEIAAKDDLHISIQTRRYPDEGENILIYL